jgi:hypothetical protein
MALRSVKLALHPSTLRHTRVYMSVLLAFKAIGQSQ